MKPKRKKFKEPMWYERDEHGSIWACKNSLMGKVMVQSVNRKFDDSLCPIRRETTVAER